MFLLICCIIRPLILNPIPATTILTNLGTLLVNNISIFVLSKANISVNLISVTPTNIDNTDSIINIRTKYFFFICSPLNDTLTNSMYIDIIHISNYLITILIYSIKFIIICLIKYFVFL